MTTARNLTYSTTARNGDRGKNTAHVLDRDRTRLHLLDQPSYRART